MRVKRLFLLLFLAIALSAYSQSSKEPWVSLDSSGKLVYRTLPRGDRIVDFSYAGYMGGGVALPTLPVARTVFPSSSDDTAAIQKAIDEVSAMTPVHGFRGAVLLAPGTFLCSQTLKITASGVVLRGSGPLAGETTLKPTGNPHAAIEIAGDEKVQAADSPAHIVEPYVPSGAQTIVLDDASSLAPGDAIRITRHTTQQWLHFMHMDKMTRDGKHETWVGNSISTIRVVASRQGNTVALDVPLTDSYDRTYLPGEGAEVTKVLIHGRIEQDGVESLHILAPTREVAFAVTASLFRAVNLSGLRDGWVRDVLADDTTEGINVDQGTSRVTIENVIFRHNAKVTSPAQPADFALRGTQTLVFRCGSIGNHLMYVITGARNQGPNVVLESRFEGDGHVQPHQRWSTGLLVDNTQVPQGGIDMMNRGEMGTGHGWTTGWGVVWNSSAANLVIQNPPGAANWSIGTSGDEMKEPMKIVGVPARDLGRNLPQGFIESRDHRVEPDSLYRAQLEQRLGPGAVATLPPGLVFYRKKH